MTQLFMRHPGPLSAVPQLDVPDGFTIRVTTDADTSAVVDVLSESFEEHWDDARMQKELSAQSGVVATWAIADDEGILAVASERLMDQYPDAGYVHWVGVAKRARGKRFGAILTARCVRGFEERGLSSAVLETDDFRVPAVITYLRLGFIPSYRSPEEERAWSALFPALVSR